MGHNLAEEKFKLEDLKNVIQQYIEQLKNEGYPAALAEINPEGIHRVAYGRYLDKKEAINMLYFIKYTLEEEAWYLEEK